MKLLIGLQEDPLFERHNGGLRTILGHFHGELLHSVDRVVVSPGVPQEKYGLSSLGHVSQHKKTVKTISFI